jgi:hypothetical protein
MITLQITKPDLTPVGDPIGDWLEVDSTLNGNGAAAGTVKLRVRQDLLADLDTAQARLVVVKDGSVWCGGPVEKRGPYARAADGTLSLSVSFTDDFGHIAAFRTYPDPAHAATAQTAGTKSWTNTNAETIARALVNDNCGPGALTARRLPSLALGVAAGVGSNIDYSTRFKPLGDELRAVLLAGGGLACRTRETTTQILFEVWEPEDRTASVRFSDALGNLRSFEYDPTAPTATVALVGNASAGASRTIVERPDTAALAYWGRWETFVNGQDKATTTALQQAGDQALADGAETAQLSLVAVDTPDQQYGSAYGLLDLVAVELWAGFEVAAAVRAVRLFADASTGEETVYPLIGSGSATSSSRLVRWLRQIERRTRALETF